MTATDLDSITIAAAADAIATRRLSPVELVRAKLARIEALDAQIGSFVTVVPERALAEARAAETEIMHGRSRGPLHGIPYGLKDVIETAGLRTTAQSRLRENHVPVADAAAQSRLQAAGAVLLGKQATWEFAHGGPSWDILFPPARNPWKSTHSPGGSSSGSAAAVAAGLCLGAIGTDTGGSIRGPAAACGVVGLKPSYGRVSRAGVMPNSFSQDHVGPLAWTVEDAALLLGAIAGHDPADPASVDLPVPDYRAALSGRADDLVIGVPRHWIDAEAPPSPATRAAFDAALETFRRLGARIEAVVLPPLQRFDDVKRTIAMADLFTIHAADLRHRPEMFGASLRWRILGGALLGAHDLVRATQMRTALCRAMQAAFAKVDLLLLPAGEPAGPLQETHPSNLFTQTSWTAPFNVTGNPAMALCAGFAEDGLPLSVQLAGRQFDESTLLRAADAFERATDWRARRPAL